MYVFSLSHVCPSFPFVFPGHPLAQIQLDGSYGGPLPARSAAHGQIVKVTWQHVCHHDREACRFFGNPGEFINQIRVSQFLPEPVFEENWCHGREGGLEPAGQKMLCVPRGEKTVGWQLLAREGCRCWPRGLNLSWKQAANS